MSSPAADIYKQLVAGADFKAQGSRLGTEFAFNMDERGRSALEMLGLVLARIVPQERGFRLAEAGEAGSIAAWIMPLCEFGPEATDVAVADLVAFTQNGTDGPWTLEGDGSPPALGLRDGGGDQLVLFTQPFLWLRYWLRACACVVDWTRGPDVYAALVLDRTRINWTAHRVEAIGPLSGRSEVHCADDPALAVFIAAKLTPPKRPKLPALTTTRRRQQEVA